MRIEKWGLGIEKNWNWIALVTSPRGHSLLWQKQLQQQLQEQQHQQQQQQQHVADNNLWLPHLSFTAASIVRFMSHEIQIYTSIAKLGSCTHCHDKSIGLFAPLQLQHRPYGSNMQLTLTYVNADKRVKTRATQWPHQFVGESAADWPYT